MSNSLIFTFAAVFSISQIVLMFFMIKNAKFILKKSTQECDGFKPVTLLTVPFKGIDIGIEENIKAFLTQDYPNFSLNFVVESENDPAYPILLRAKNAYEGKTLAKSVNVLIAGIASQGSQKNHNLLHSIAKAPQDVTVFAFADSDARPNAQWLDYLVYSLHSRAAGASTGYRWIIPAKYNAATLLLSSINAKVAQFLGKSSIFNQAWGGSMAVKREVFYSLGIDKIWETAISDDLSLTYAVKRSGYKLRFAPACIVATFEQTSFRGLFEFGRRQFLITRKSVPLLWLLGVVCSLYSIGGMWGFLFWGIFGTFDNKLCAISLIYTSVVFFLCQMARVYIRQHLVAIILKIHRSNLKKTVIFDYIMAPLGSLILLLIIISSLFGSTIVWRGRRYKIIDGCRTVQIAKKEKT